MGDDCRVVFHSANRTIQVSGFLIGASLRVTTQFIGHNVQMTGIGFVTLAEIFKYLNVNMLRKSVIGRNEAIYCQLNIYRLLHSYQ